MTMYYLLFLLDLSLTYFNYFYYLLVFGVRLIENINCDTYLFCLFFFYNGTWIMFFLALVCCFSLGFRDFDRVPNGMGEMGSNDGSWAWVKGMYLYCCC